MTSLSETNLTYSGDEHPVHGTWLSVDVVALTEDLPAAKVVLIERKDAPRKGAVTLPGGLLAAWNGETVEDAARRIVREKIGVEVSSGPVGTETSGVVPLTVVSDPHRDERGHTVSIVVAVRVPAGTPGAVPADEVPPDMPFEHSEILRKGLATLGNRLLTDPETTYGLLGDETTFPEAFAVTRACSSLPENTVRARLERSELYSATDLVRKGSGRGRPSRVYRI